MEWYKRYLVYCVIGVFVEFVTGYFWYFVLDHFIWIYPGSFLVTTSLLAMPLWGAVGLIFERAYLVLRNEKKKK
jgi:hypothetical protein